MDTKPEVQISPDYRQARKAFIAAAQAAGVDVVTRVHPHVQGPDGKPLFADAVALGPRDASRALMLVSQDAMGSAVQTALLRAKAGPPKGARLVMLHARDPAAFAGVAMPGDAWPDIAQRDVVAEDLSRAKSLEILLLAGRATDFAALHREVLDAIAAL